MDTSTGTGRPAQCSGATSALYGTVSKAKGDDLSCQQQRYHKVTAAASGSTLRLSGRSLLQPLFNGRNHSGAPGFTLLNGSRKLRQRGRLFLAFQAGSTRLSLRMTAREPYSGVPRRRSATKSPSRCLTTTSQTWSSTAQDGKKVEPCTEGSVRLRSCQGLSSHRGPDRCLFLGFGRPFRRIA